MSRSADPVDEFTVEQAFTRYVLRTDPSIPRDGIQPIVADLESTWLRLSLGGGHRRDAAAMARAASTGIEDASLHLNPRESRAIPGTRAPHYWLQRDGQQLSTLDLIDRHFVLLAAADGGAWCTSARDAATSSEWSSMCFAWDGTIAGSQRRIHCRVWHRAVGLRAGQPGRFRCLAREERHRRLCEDVQEALANLLCRRRTAGAW